MIGELRKSSVIMDEICSCYRKSMTVRGYYIFIIKGNSDLSTFFLIWRIIYDVPFKLRGFILKIRNTFIDGFIDLSSHGTLCGIVGKNY